MFIVEKNRANNILHIICSTFTQQIHASNTIVTSEHSADFKFTLKHDVHTINGPTEELPHSALNLFHTWLDIVHPVNCATAQELNK